MLADTFLAVLTNFVSDVDTVTFLKKWKPIEIGTSATKMYDTLTSSLLIRR